VLKSIFCAFISHIENSPLWRTNHNPTFIRFNPSPSLSSAATDDSKEIQCISKVLKIKTGPLFLEYN